MSFLFSLFAWWFIFCAHDHLFSTSFKTNSPLVMPDYFFPDNWAQVIRAPPKAGRPIVISPSVRRTVRPSVRPSITKSCPLHILKTVIFSKFILHMYINQHKSCVIMFVQICRSTVKVKNLDFIMEPHDLWERSCPLHTLRTIRISLYLTCLLSNNFVGQRSR